MKSTSEKSVFKLNPISCEFAKSEGKEKIDTFFSVLLRNEYLNLHSNTTSFLYLN